MNPTPWLRRLAILLVLTVSAFAAAPQAPIPVLFDTDIGTDIDDAYALAQILHSPELQLVGVTTVSGDAVARARLAAKLLAVAGQPGIPVYAGTSTAAQNMKHAEWAAGFTSPALHESGGVEFLRQQINARPGELTLIAVGEMTNVAALLESEPGIGRKIKAIALMGGSVRRGYAPASAPEPEWNLKSNIRAAQIVFASGVPLLVAPLDSTADLKLTSAWKVRLFSQGTPLNDALASLDYVWRHTNHWGGTDPTLFDNLAVALVATPGVAPLTPLHLTVEADGLTREHADRPANAQVVLTTDIPAFLEYFTARLER
ncbi:Pyrimidine-specific ribonucleoside hydrolase RihA [Lacunisphaera limnophila]|uniref:Pyrimidine-specific ribonucleoside hydrolase RihA n=1 Tax=Lacunisphaera limnophila TaxID=1838286 RepID=A0A1D8AT88_9BACT|nr:nucleoside hydrolase [Lacunisphaera limnophila]AOS44107.1 Pyrimidine-specific ribonucleoside hydrolase RihA [Lacunisphaera limnophila]